MPEPPTSIGSTLPVRATLTGLDRAPSDSPRCIPIQNRSVLTERLDIRHSDDTVVCGRAPGEAADGLPTAAGQHARVPRFRVPEEPLEFLGYRARGQVSPADRVIDTHATKRPCQRLCRKPEGGHREVRALSGRVPMERLGTHAPDSADTQLRVGEGIISNESRAREIRTLGSTSGERKRGQGGGRVTGTVAKAIGSTLHPRQARLSSTLLARPRRGRSRVGLAELAVGHVRVDAEKSQTSSLTMLDNAPPRGLPFNWNRSA